MNAPMPLEELREVARKRRSVNVDLADHYSLRWHDPYFISAWERWNTARSAWDKTWPNVDFKFLRESTFTPNPEGMPEDQAAVAREYLDAKTSYLNVIKQYDQSQV